MENLVEGLLFFFFFLQHNFKQLEPICYAVVYSTFSFFAKQKWTFQKV